MKKFFLLIAIAAALWQSAAAEDFPIIWQKDMGAGISHVEFSHDSKWLLVWVAAYNHIFEVPSGNIVNNTIRSTELEHPFFSVDDKYIFGYTDNKIYKYSTETWQYVSSFELADDSIETLAMSYDGKFIVAKTKSSLTSWSVETGKIINSKIVPPEKPNEIDQDDRQIHISCDNTKIYLLRWQRYMVIPWPESKDFFSNKIIAYDFNTLDSIDIIARKDTITNGAAPYISSFYQSGDCKLIAIVYTNYSTGHYINIYDTETKQVIKTLTNTGFPKYLKFTNDNKFLINITGGIFIYDILSEKEIKRGPTGTTYTATLSPDFKYISTSLEELLSLFGQNFLDILDSKDYIRELYPNPATSEVIIELPVMPLKEIRLIDSNGRLLKIFDINFILNQNQIIKINLDLYPSGIYFLKLTGSDYNKTYKVILNK